MKDVRELYQPNYLAEDAKQEDFTRFIMEEYNKLSLTLREVGEEIDNLTARITKLEANP